MFGWPIFANGHRFWETFDHFYFRGPVASFPARNALPERRVDTAFLAGASMAGRQFQISRL